MSESIPSELDFDFEARRARLVRRRFLWMCGARIALAVIGGIAFLVFLYVQSEFRPADRVRAATSLFNLLVFTTAGAYAWRTPPQSRRLLSAVFWLVVLTGAANLVAARLIAGFDHHPSGDLAAGYLQDALTAILINHFVAALFIRWSIREALAPALALFAVNLVITATFLPHHAGALAFLLLLLSPLCVAPGLLVCWWRYSRLRETFRLQFESGQYRQLQAELTSARRLHESLLPPQQHDGPVRLSYVYEPMRQIGGDLIYLHHESDGCLSAVVLDVTGHGIPAALTVNRLIGELDRLFAETPGISASQVIRSLNRYVALTLSRHGIFVTAFCARVDCDDETLEWCNGGHPPAFVRRRTGELQPLESTAPLLGLDDHQAYAPDDERTRFGPGDALVCYTDGAAEAMDPDHRMVGIVGVERLLARCAAESSSPREWPAAILRGIFAHRQAPPEDDTLVAVIYRPTAVSSPSMRPTEQLVPQPV